MNNIFRIFIIMFSFAISSTFANASTCAEVAGMSPSDFQKALQTSPEYYNTLMGQCITDTSEACASTDDVAGCVQNLWKYRDEATYYANLKQIAATRATINPSNMPTSVQSKAPNTITSNTNQPSATIASPPQQHPVSDNSENNTDFAAVPNNNDNNNDIYKNIRF